uniref:Putative ovule protein n=1 Tax=Solanum chacoense TaxID=4108 RepID=A0A0V0GTV8_SOLCH
MIRTHISYHFATTFPELFGAIGRLLRVEFIHGPWGQIFYMSRNPRCHCKCRIDICKREVFFRAHAYTTFVNVRRFQEA